MDDNWLPALADLAVRGGANVQPGQVVSLSCQPGQERLAREVAHAAYRAGAKYVDVTWHDPFVKRARALHAAEDTLDWAPPWLGERAKHLGRMSAAVVSLSGPVAPGSSTTAIRCGWRATGSRRSRRPWPW